MRNVHASVGVQVRELDRSIAFYRDLLGMQIVRRRKVPETRGEWAELRSSASDHDLELNRYPEGSAHHRGPYRNGDDLDHIASDCEDARVAFRELVPKGARPGLEPFLEADTWLAYVLDPDGLWIELASKAEA